LPPDDLAGTGGEVEDLGIAIVLKPGSGRYWNAT